MYETIFIMTQEDKQLLIQDLCTRLPYHVIVDYNGANVDLTQYVHSVKLENCKPNLRPMSNMTKDERYEYNNLCIKNDSQDTIKSIDQLNSNHFDYRGLIEKGLAFEAPEGMYNIKTK